MSKLNSFKVGDYSVRFVPRAGQRAAHWLITRDGHYVFSTTHRSEAVKLCKSRMKEKTDGTAQAEV